MAERLTLAIPNIVVRTLVSHYHRLLELDTLFILYLSQWTASAWCGRKFNIGYHPVGHSS
jgi:hypothetical protein